MKKIVLLICLIPVFGFIGCDTSNNCICTIKTTEGETFKDNIGVKDTDSKCEEMPWSELPDEWKDMNVTGEYTLECVEE